MKDYLQVSRGEAKVRAADEAAKPVAKIRKYKND